MNSLDDGLRDRILCGDALAMLRTLPDECVQCVVTSPPYWGLRDYGVAGQLGLEPTPQEWVESMVAIFAEVRRALRRDGTLWLNVGDCYANDTKWGGTSGGVMAKGLHGKQDVGYRRKRNTGLKPKDLVGLPWMLAFALRADGWWLRSDIVWHKPNPMPESVTDRPTRSHEYIFLLTRSGEPTFWTHRDGCEVERAPRPDYRWLDDETGEETSEEPAEWRKVRLPDGRNRWRRVNLWTAHCYRYDAEAIREPLRPKTYTTFGTTHRSKGNDGLGGVKADNWARTVKVRRPKLPAGWDVDPGTHGRFHRDGRERTDKQRGHSRRHAGVNDRWDAMDREQQMALGANKRDVWTVGTRPFKGAHFATFPPRLIEPCVLAGSRPGDVVLDPFMGAGTTAVVARRHSRHYLGIELNPSYIALAQNRIAREVQPVLWTSVSSDSLSA